MYVHFHDLFSKADTKLATLEPPEGDDPIQLQGIHELTLRRNMSVCREAFKTTVNNDLTSLADWFTKYISLLHQLILHKTKNRFSTQGAAGSAGFLWSSPLSELPSTAHFSLDSLLLEEIMTLLMYAALLQEQAQKMCDALLKGAELADSPEKQLNVSANNNANETTPIDALAAASLFRKAAGIYAYIRKELLPPAISHLPTDSPCELSAAALEGLEITSLARAQGVAAYRAEGKGASSSALVAVHMGAVSLWEAAAIKARSVTGPRPASQRYQRYLAVSSGLHEAKALRAQAAICRDNHDLGLAVACLKAATAKVSQCLIVAEKDDEWKPAFRDELAAIEAVFKVYDRERQLVHMQTVAGAAASLPPGKVLVSVTEFEFPESVDHYFL